MIACKVLAIHYQSEGIGQDPISRTLAERPGVSVESLPTQIRTILASPTSYHELHIDSDQVFSPVYSANVGIQARSFENSESFQRTFNPGFTVVEHPDGHLSATVKRRLNDRVKRFGSRLSSRLHYTYSSSRLADGACVLRFGSRVWKEVNALPAERTAGTELVALNTDY